MKLGENGLTILELLITITILLIGASIAIPSILEMGKRDGIRSDARDLKNIFFRSRMEAVKLNRSVTVAFNCNGSDYISFIDNNQSCEYDLGDEILYQQNLHYCTFDNTEAGGDGLSFIANDHGFPALRWDSKGIPNRNGAGFGAGTAYLVGEHAHYKVIVSKTGNIRITTY